MNGGAIIGGLVFLGVLAILASGREESPRKKEMAQITQLQETINHREKSLSHFLGAETFQRYSSTVNVLVPVSYIREGYATQDLIDFKFMEIGDWVKVDGIGLIRIVGIKERGENTITIAGMRRGMKKTAYARRVDWMR